MARFAREAAVAGGLAHPNIVTVHDFGSTTHNGQKCAYLVMELLPGKPLSAALEAGRLPLPKALSVATCVADALKAAHNADLTHRDIKPSNIIIRSNGKATVVDFGITKGSDERHDITTTGVLIGTPAYIAPEALAGTFEHRSDLYSLGCVLYEMVTGRRPFTGTSWHLVNQHIKEQPVPLRTLRPDAPVELERFVARLLAKDPAQRPVSAGKVRDVRKEINDRTSGPHRPAAARTSSPRCSSPGRKPQTARSSPCGSPPATPAPPAPPGQTRRRQKSAPPARERAGSSASSTPTRSASPRASRTARRSGSASSAAPARTAVRPVICTSRCTSPTDQPPDSGTPTSTPDAAVLDAAVWSRPSGPVCSDGLPAPGRPALADSADASNRAGLVTGLSAQRRRQAAALRRIEPSPPAARAGASKTSTGRSPPRCEQRRATHGVRIARYRRVAGRAPVHVWVGPPHGQA